MDPIVTIDANQRIVLFNAAAERVFGWPRDAVIGELVDKLLPERYRQNHRGHVEHFGRTGTTARRMGDTTVLTALRAKRRGIPDRSLDLAAQRGGPAAIHGHLA
jgi:PAS domain S-box-containing protein